MLIGIIGAMEVEVAHLTARMTDTVAHSRAGRTVYTGTLEGCPVAVVRSGIGKAAAAGTAQMLIDVFGVTALINTGMAGGLDPRLQIKDLVVGTDAVHHDFDLTPFGYAMGYMSSDLGNGIKNEPTAFAADPALVALALKVGPALLPPGGQVITGRIASGDVFIDDSARKRQIRDGFHAAATEMEGAAIAQTAFVNQIPFLILRVISDLAEHQANTTSEQMEQFTGDLAGKICAAIVRELSESGE